MENRTESLSSQETIFQLSEHHTGKNLDLNISVTIKAFEVLLYLAPKELRLGKNWLDRIYKQKIAIEELKKSVNSELSKRLLVGDININEKEGSNE